MENRAQVVIGVIIVLVAVPSVVAVADSPLDVLSNVGFVIAGVLFVVGGLGRTVEVGGRTLESHHFIGLASIFIAAAILPSVVTAFVGENSDVFYGVVITVAAFSVATIGLMQMRGEFDTT